MEKTKIHKSVFIRKRRILANPSQKRKNKKSKPKIKYKHQGK